MSIWIFSLGGSGTDESSTSCSETICRLFRNQLGYKGENEVCVSDFARRNCPFLLAAPSQQQPECLVPSVRLHDLYNMGSYLQFRYLKWPSLMWDCNNPHAELPENRGFKHAVAILIRKRMMIRQIWRYPIFKQAYAQLGSDMVATQKSK